MDRYGYLVNPVEATAGPKKWFWIAGLLAAATVVFWLASRSAGSPVGKYSRQGASQKGIAQYTVTAPVTELLYEGAGMPFDIQYYQPAAGEWHIEVDNNGIARLVTSSGIPGGLIKTVTGGTYFVSEEELNAALCGMRELNSDILLAVVPYNMVGPGYLGYCTSGAHIGEAIYVTLAGQIGRALNKIEGGDLTFVPLDLIDQMDNIWSIYIKPGG